MLIDSETANGMEHFSQETVIITTKVWDSQHQRQWAQQCSFHWLHVCALTRDTVEMQCILTSLSLQWASNCRDHSISQASSGENRGHSQRLTLRNHSQPNAQTEVARMHCWSNARSRPVHYRANLVTYQIRPVSLLRKLDNRCDTYTWRFIESCQFPQN